MAKTIYDEITAAKEARAELISGIDNAIEAAFAAKEEAKAAADAATAAGDSAAYIEAKEAEVTADAKITFYTDQLATAKEKTLFPSEEWAAKTEAIRSAVNSANASNAASIKTHLAAALELAEAIKDETIKGAKAEEAIRNTVGGAEPGNSGFTSGAWYLLKTINIALNNEYLNAITQ